jgi:hypothetical protein
MNADGHGFGVAGAGAMAPAPPTSRRRFPVAGSGKSLPRGPQNVKERAHERHTGFILPQFRGTATFILTFIFHMNSPQTLAECTEPEGGRIFADSISARLAVRTPCWVRACGGADAKKDGKKARK